ncbi:MAG TPA: HAD family hydrolase [Acidimicrobiales bacterium]|nr:HAD family hydrolase [Acidimicrobiales bacterium]
MGERVVIEAVVFDGDQTLWDFQRVMREALVAVAEELRAARPGPFADELRWQDLERDRQAVGGELAGVEWSMAALRGHGFARTLARRRAAEGGDEAADAALARQLSDSYFAHRDRDPALFPDTLPCLDALRAEYRLGLLSNGSRLPETVGLSAYFESVVFAQDHRVAKPDKGIFEVAERQLGVDPTACVLVGDHLVNDVAGAKRAGWRAVWLDRAGQGAFSSVDRDADDVDDADDADDAEGVPEQRHDERPDATVRSLDELPAVLRRLS